MLTLNVPGTNTALQHPVETRPKAVAEWLGRLPFANPADTAQQLLVALYALNRHALGADERHGGPHRIKRLARGLCLDLL